MLLLSYQSETFAQLEGQSLADSLERELAKSDISERERVDLLTVLTYEYRNLLPSKAVTYGIEAETLAKQIGYEEKFGILYVYLAAAFAVYNDLVRSYEYAMLGVKYSTEFGQSDVIPWAKATAIYTNPNWNNASVIRELDQLMPELNAMQDRELYIMSLGLIGNGYRSAGQLEKGLSLIRGGNYGSPETSLQISGNS